MTGVMADRPHYPVHPSPAHTAQGSQPQQCPRAGLLSPTSSPASLGKDHSIFLTSWVHGSRKPGGLPSVSPHFDLNSNQIPGPSTPHPAFFPTLPLPVFGQPLRPPRLSRLTLEGCQAKLLRCRNDVPHSSPSVTAPRRRKPGAVRAGRVALCCQPPGRPAVVTVRCLRDPRAKDAPPGSSLHLILSDGQ